MLTNMTRIEQLLMAPDPEATLEDLKNELNELAKLRDTSRVAFCTRLAAAYMLFTGRPLSKEEPKDGSSKKFYEWCRTNIRSGNGKEYSTGTLRSYLGVGFSANPTVALRQKREMGNRRSELMRHLGMQVEKAIRAESKPKVVPITKLREKFKLPSNVAQEVNSLMRAWEEASSEARGQLDRKSVV